MFPTSNETDFPVRLDTIALIVWFMANLQPIGPPCSVTSTGAWHGKEFVNEIEYGVFGRIVFGPIAENPCPLQYPMIKMPMISNSKNHIIQRFVTNRVTKLILSRKN
uniref:(northern house mosquito) hypothetical protein n=1 Tax=Culex pipiens TaxID=7175 RepID=A0A8D8AUS8_CULPI